MYVVWIRAVFFKYAVWIRVVALSSKSQVFASACPPVDTFLSWISGNQGRLYSSSLVQEKTRLVLDTVTTLVHTTSLQETFAKEDSNVIP